MGAELDGADYVSPRKSLAGLGLRRGGARQETRSVKHVLHHTRYGPDQARCLPRPSPFKPNSGPPRFVMYVCTYSALGSLDKTGRADIELFVVVGRARSRGRIHAHVALTDPRMTTRAWDIVCGSVAGSRMMPFQDKGTRSAKVGVGPRVEEVAYPAAGKSGTLCGDQMVELMEGNERPIDKAGKWVGRRQRCISRGGRTSVITIHYRNITTLLNPLRSTHRPPGLNRNLTCGQKVTRNLIKHWTL